MARAIWTGSITFGLVSIPVGLFSATEDHTIHFHQFQRGTSDRVRNQRVNERTGAEVPYADMVKGADVGGGEHVVVEPDELSAIAPGRSQSLEISDFVDLSEIDPIYFDKTYWLAPTNDHFARPYALLLEAMERTGRAAVGSFVMRGKEYLAAIRPDNGVLALETLFFADEVRNPDEQLDHLPERGQARGKELDMAVSLIESMSGAWQPDKYHDSYRERVEKLIEDKRRGREVVTEAQPPEPTEMSDLLAALERSVAARRGSGDDELAGNGQKAEAPKASSRRARGSTSSKASGPDLADATKAQLTELAREYDIPGRSSMNRDQLAEAVTRAASRSEPRRRAS